MNRPLSFNHTGRLRERDQNRDMDELVVWFYVSKQGPAPIVLHCSGSGPDPYDGTGYNQCDYTISGYERDITLTVCLPNRRKNRVGSPVGSVPRVLFSTEQPAQWVPTGRGTRSSGPASFPGSLRRHGRRR